MTDSKELRKCKAEFETLLEAKRNLEIENNELKTKILGLEEEVKGYNQ